MAGSTQPLSRQTKVLLTRPLPAIHRTQSDFNDLGFDVLASPLLDITHLENLADLPPFEAICLTSSNAILGLKDRVPFATPLFCVGQGSAKRVRDLGYQTVFCAPGALDLEHLIQQELPKGARIVYLAGSVIRYPLDQALKERGYLCDKQIVYHADPIEFFAPEITQEFQKGNVGIVCFYSPRTAEVFGQLMEKSKVDLKNVCALALSQEVADGLHGLGFSQIRVAQEPTHASLIKELG